MHAKQHEKKQAEAKRVEQQRLADRVKECALSAAQRFKQSHANVLTADKHAT